MRAGIGCSVQQSLSPEAASVVKQAVALAKRRGHAQVTPLHVANTMLSSSAGLLRAACLQSHSHPLQCKALELCFNVALNRLPASSSGPMMGPSSHSQYPSISNALVAAFKRAQAHQRRGSIENQQQPAVKIELEQLVISILDDPSVSRVMREAGFSSTQVKTNVEKTVVLEISPQNSPSQATSKPKESIRSERRRTSTEQELARREDVELVMETLLSSRKSKSIVIVGESINNIESTVKGLMERVDKAEVPKDLREVKLITIPPLYTFCNLRREEVEQKIGELSCLVRSLVAKGVVLYLGDLKWISEYRVNLEQEKSYYCSVEHMIMELGKLAFGVNGESSSINGRFWLMGIATFQTYMRCRNGYHSLENVWGLHPVTIPANSLGLSLIPDHSDEKNEVRRGRVDSNEVMPTNGDVKLTCCSDCSAKFEDEAGELRRRRTNMVSLSSLPPWLKGETTRLGHNDENCEYLIKELCKKWNTYCSSTHKHPHFLGRTLTFPSSSVSLFSFDQSNPNSHQNSNLHTWKDSYPFWPGSTSSNPSSTPNSTSSSDVIMEIEYTPKFKEFNAENLNTLCNSLERKVPWHKDVIPDIAGTILQCRSGMMKRKDSVQNTNGVDIKEETWLLFLGLDTLAKERVSRELAKVVFGSYSNFATIGLSGFALSEACRNKRGRDEESSGSYIDRFAEALVANPHRVFLVEDLEQADQVSQMRVKRAIETGRMTKESGEEVSFCDAIVVLSCESLRSMDSPRQKVEHWNNGDGDDEDARRVSLDLNISCENHSDEDQSFDDLLGILEIVDKRVCFNIQDF